MKVKIKVRSGKGGTKLAVARANITRANERTKIDRKPFYQTRAQMNIHIRGEERSTTFRPRNSS